MVRLFHRGFAQYNAINIVCIYIYIFVYIFPVDGAHADAGEMESIRFGDARDSHAFMMYYSLFPASGLARGFYLVLQTDILCYIHIYMYADMNLDKAH